MAEFLERTRSFRAGKPYLTNVMGTTATSVAPGLRTYEKTSWWVVEDSNGVVGMLMRTAPHNLVPSTMPADAIGPAVEAVLLDDPGIAGASGPTQLCESFLSLFVLRSDRALRREVERNLFVYVLGTPVAPSPVAGSMRRCSGNDLEQLLPWCPGFAHDTGVQRHGLEEGLASSLAQGRVHVWMRDDVAVCAVAHSPIVATPGGSVARVGPVYTPPEERRRGYGGPAHVRRVIAARRSGPRTHALHRRGQPDLPRRLRPARLREGRRDGGVLPRTGAGRANQRRVTSRPDVTGGAVTPADLNASRLAGVGRLMK